MSELGGFKSELIDLAQLLEKSQVPYMIIGGLANAVWGNPRATIDIDVAVWVPDERITDVLKAIEKNYTLRVEKPLAFISETRVLPVKSKCDLNIDIIFGALPFEKAAIDRAVAVDVGDARIKFCTAEDLVLLKIISERPQDLEDVRSILQFQKNNLDSDYLEPRVASLSDLLDRPDIMRNYRKWKVVSQRK